MTLKIKLNQKQKLIFVPKMQLAIISSPVAEAL